MKSSLRFLAVAICLLPSIAVAQQTSETSTKLRRTLTRFPRSDANGDGILTQAEANKFRREQRANRRKNRPHIAPKPTHQNVEYGPYLRNLYDLWLPVSDEPTPLIIYVHGGGFRNGDKSVIRSRSIVQDALDAGVAFASINYRFVYRFRADLKNPEKTSIQKVLRDAALALQHIRHHAADYNIDKDRIGMFGGSAGAGTSLFVGFHDDLADPEHPDPVRRESTRLAVVGMLNGQCSYDIKSWDRYFEERFAGMQTYGQIVGTADFSPFYGLTQGQYVSRRGKTARADVDMINHITPDDPPVFIFCGNPADQPATLGEVQHHPLHAELIEARCIEQGVENQTFLTKVRPEDRGINNMQALLEFFLKQLNSGDAQ